MRIIQRSLGVLVAGMVLGLALAGFTALQDLDATAANVVGVIIVAFLAVSIFRIGK